MSYFVLSSQWTKCRYNSSSVLSAHTPNCRYQNGTIDGYPTQISNRVTDSFAKGTGTVSVIFYSSDWQYLTVATWGNTALIIDPYSSAPSSTIRLIWHQFVDYKILRDEALATEKSKGAVELDNTPINLQNGRLNGSDYVEGINPKSGRNWRVYRSFDLREISFLIGLEPAWKGVYGQLGSGKPEPTPNNQAWRARELAMVELRC